MRGDGGWQESLRRSAAVFGLVIAVLVALVVIVLVSPPQSYLVAVLALLGGVASWFATRGSADAPPAQASVTLAAAAPTPPPRSPAAVAAAGDSSALMAELDQLRNVHKEVVRAKQDAEAAMMAKSEFLATMSHEIRTPLNGIIPLLDIVLTTKLAPDQRDYVQTAYKSARELLRIVDDILDYSKIEANKLELETVGMNLREIIDAVKRLMEKSAEGKGLAFHVALDPGVRLAVRGDPVRLRQVLTNLVSNAIKFTERGSVSIRVSKRGETRTHNEVLFQVQDTGVGIAQEAADKLFQAFSQADASTTRIHGGTGLGLVICKRIVDLMGGKIGVKSELGKGSVFWFSVPFLKAHGDVSHRRDLTGARALVVSDDAAFQRKTGSQFGSWGMHMLTTNVAAEALAKLRSAAQMGDTWAYDVVVVDLGSLRGNPLTLLRNITREPTLDRVRCVFVVGAEEPPAELKSEARAAVLPAGYNDAELRAALSKLLEVDEAAGSGPRYNLLADSETRDAPQVQIAAPAAAAPTLAGHVLLVEDNPINRQVAQRLLGLLGVSLDVAENGKEAVDRLEVGRYDVVLMDCQMPVMDGYTATRMRRMQEAEKKAKRIPILAMTANAMAGDREKCLAAGMDDYMSKPLNRGLLEQTLRKWLPKDARSRGTPNVAAVAPPLPTRERDSTPPPLRVPSTRPASPVSAEPAAGGVTLAEGMASDPLARRDGAALDQEVVRDLLDVMGEEFTALVHVYLEDTPKNLAMLEQAAVRNDTPNLIAPSHSLKSTSANLGALTLSEIAKRIEHGARSGTLDNPGALVRELSNEYRRVSAELKNLLAKSGG